VKIIKNLGIFLLVIYFLICIGLYISQDKIFFTPQKLSESYTFRAGEEIEIPVAPAISLNCLWLKESNSKGVILYLHGNRGSNRRCLRQAQTMAGNQYDIFMPDYRGYGKSDGEIQSEAQLYEDVQKVYDFLKEKYRENQIVIVGYSLGSGMASWLAANNNPKRLFLVAPYISFIDLKERYTMFLPNFLVKYPLNNKEHLEAVRCPVTLFHGTSDELIPFDSSVQLAKINSSRINLVKLEGVGHRGAIFNGLFRSTVRKLLREN